MEPEVIRMYSSSPPPLDSVADDDEDDEFGEFGGFSGVGNSGMGFSDFDAVNYAKSHEDFIPSKHFMPIHDYSDNVNNYSSLTSVPDKQIVSEITSKKGPCRVLETNNSNELSPYIAALENKGSLAENLKRADFNVDSENSISGVGSTELNSKEEPIAGTCNGEKAHCPENLTNGFAVVDSVDPQGKEDLDSIHGSKGLKSFTTLSTDLDLEFTPSPEDEFADFSLFSKNDSVHLEHLHLKTNRGSHEGETADIKETTTLNSNENDSIKKVLPDLVSGNGDKVGDLDCTNCISEGDTMSDDIVEPHVASTSAVMQLMDTERVSGKIRELVQNKEDFPETDDVSYVTQVQSLEMVETNQNTIPNLNSDDNYNSDDLSSVLKDNILSENENASHPVSENVFWNSEVPIRNQPLSSTDHSKVQLDANVNKLNDDFGEFEEINTVPFEVEPKVTPDETSAFQDSGEKHSGFESHNDLESFDDFGDFNSTAKTGDQSSFQESDDFADFSAAGKTDQSSDWKAFDDDHIESSAWNAFDQETDYSAADSESWQTHRTNVPSSDQAINMQSDVTPVFHESEPNFLTNGSTSGSQQSLLSRLERIIQVCFPPPPVSETEESIPSLDDLLTVTLEKTTKSMAGTREVLDIWPELQDIHDVYALKHQWGGSQSNKKLLCSLGIDTRNILFTGNKKQPVIVPMYAAGLGMLEPTKEPLKPLSAAEKIASIGQSSPVHPAEGICASVQLQESLPPVQFDWSSSGLTNPLDANGGSTLLNLDFFGPVDESGSSTTTFPGVDPELYALTTSKVDSSATGSRVTDAFARLMSTAETTSTSTRKPKREENLSEEAANVISSLPDLSFMHAKVLMFPATLTPSSNSQETVD
ncbi:aftiphilin isoform X1 [Pelobates cultripes]|uniref:Aftiphilin isoform X1 n=1 Tax=Pelobates cultripes TaxID=61616 RepID=A0AAD1RGM0_PELCU|nr:aftiphilin isoform X1 [Pelobates cultripes]